MKRVLLLLSIICGFVLYSTGGFFTAEPSGSGSIEVLPDQPIEPVATGTITITELPLSKQGIISEARGTSRVGHSRTQRVVPANSQSASRTHGRSAFYYQSTPRTLKHIFDGRRLETAPFQCAAVRHYYIIALRRLII